MRGSMGGMSAGRMFLEADEYLKKLLDRAFALIVENERWVMAIAHALEQHFTITGEDIVAIFEGTQGPIVDGRWYHTDDFVDQYRQYHEVALQAHQHQGRLETALPLPQLVEAHETAGATDGALWSAMPEPVFNGNGNGNGFGSDGPLTLPPPPPPPSELP